MNAQSQQLNNIINLDAADVIDDAAKVKALVAFLKIDYKLKLRE